MYVDQNLNEIDEREILNQTIELVEYDDDIIHELDIDQATIIAHQDTAYPKIKILMNILFAFLLFIFGIFCLNVYCCVYYS